MMGTTLRATRSTHIAAALVIATLAVPGLRADDARPRSDRPNSARATEEWPADVSGLAIFWATHELLAKDVEPDAGHWGRFAETGGYSRIGRENVRDLQERMRLAYKPSRGAELTRALAGGERQAELLRHLAEAAALRRRSQPVDTGSLFRGVYPEARRRALAYLPAAAATITERPPLTLSIFGPDANANGGAINFDLVFADSIGHEQRVRFVAHELHHHFATKLSKVRKLGPEEARQEIAGALSGLYMEGIADFIDKVRAPISSDLPVSARLVASYNAEYEAAPARLRALDDLLCRAAASPSEERSAGVAMRALLKMGGHPVGFFMANVIREAHGKKALVATVGDPYLFFAKYNAAAKRRNRAHVFSPCSQEYVARLRAELRLPPDGAAPHAPRPRPENQPPGR